jgi:hypothetical protein
MIPHLLRRTLATVGSTYLLVFAAGTLAGSVRLMPWLAADAVPLAVTVAFAKVLLVAAAEVALLVAPPLGCAVEAARWLGDGTARTLHTLGVSPRRLLIPAGLAGLTAACLALVLSMAHQAHEPVRFSNALLAQSRAAVCSQAPLAHVPVVNVSWLCVDGTPQLVGAWPQRGAASLVWSAAAAEFPPDLTSLTLRDVRLATRASRVQVRANAVVVRGFEPWLVSATIAPWQRGLAYGLCAWFASLAAAGCVLRGGHPSRARALAVGIVGPALFLLSGAHRAPALGLAICLLLGTLAPLLVHICVKAGSQLPCYRRGDTG